MRRLLVGLSPRGGVSAEEPQSDGRGPANSGVSSWGAAFGTARDASPPVGPSDGPADLDLADAINDAVLGHAPPDAGLTLPSQRPAELIDGPMSDLPRHHLLALRQSERAAGAKPGCHLRIPQQALVDSRCVGPKQQPDERDRSAAAASARRAHPRGPPTRLFGSPPARLPPARRPRVREDVGSASTAG